MCPHYLQSLQQHRAGGRDLGTEATHYYMSHLGAEYIWSKAKGRVEREQNVRGRTTEGIEIVFYSFGNASFVKR